MKLLVLILENLAAPFVVIAIFVRFLFSPRRGLLLSLPDEIRERGGLLRDEQVSRLSGRPVLWVHAASAGEVQAVAPLIARLKRAPEAPAIILTTSTAAGRRSAQESTEADLAVLAPIDSLPTVSGFLHTTRPYALIIVETELWPHMIELSHRAGVRIGIVNGRMTERSFRRYRLFSWLIRPFLSGIERFALQTNGDAERLLTLGARPGCVKVTGNMKYDRERPGEDPSIRRRLEKLGWAGSPLFVAGSTHPGEEEEVVAAFLAARKKVPELRLVLAPRHVERATETATILENQGMIYCRWSVGDINGKAQALILDAMGVLGGFYPHAAVSFVGGTLAPVGGHNLLEPALAGVPVIFGPHTGHIREVADMLEEAGCGFRVEGAEDLGDRIVVLLSDPDEAKRVGAKARETGERLQGATQRTLEHVSDMIKIPEERS